MANKRLIDAAVLQAEYDELGKTMKGKTTTERMAEVVFVTTSHLARNVSAALEEIKARIAELDTAPLQYAGPHEVGKTYQRGTFVTHGGSLWHANYTTAAKPGDGPAWTLAVKSGRDGRDAK